MYERRYERKLACTLPYEVVHFIAWIINQINIENYYCLISNVMFYIYDLGVNLNCSIPLLTTYEP
jgi:hypothetical protein